MRTPAYVVHAQYEAYNAGDAALLASFYADDCVVTDLDGAVLLEGRAAFQARFAKTFQEHPLNRSWSSGRMIVGDRVIDHEMNQRAPGTPVSAGLAIYTVRDGLIVRLAMGAA